MLGVIALTSSGAGPSKRKCLHHKGLRSQYRTIATNAIVVHTTNTVQTYTLAHVTHKHSRATMNRNQSIERMLYLDGHRSSCNKKWNVNKQVNSPKNQKALNTQPKHHTVDVYVVGVFTKQIVTNPVFHFRQPLGCYR